jgi:transposase
MEALLLKSEGLSHKQIGQIVGVSQSKLRTYFDQYQRGGIEELFLG